MQQKTTSKFILLVLLFSTLYCFAAQPVLIQNYNSKLSSSSSEVYDCVDAWIIIGGDKTSHSHWDLVLRSTEWIYDRVIDCGCFESNIYYIVPEYSQHHTLREDNTTSHASLDYAFHTWAPTKVGENGVLGVYMHDHGGDNGMHIAPDGGYFAQEFDDDLDAFEAASGCNRIIVIYEACGSGGFLDELSQDNRIILTSTEPGYSAWWSPIYPHISMFGEALFNSMLAGNSIGDAFVDSQNEINALGYGDVQHPCIEDNHDGVGHIVNAWGQLPSTGDGNDALKTYLCVNCPTINLDFPIFRIPIKTWFTYDPFLVAIPIEVEIINFAAIDEVFVRAVPDDWEPPDPLENDTMGEWDPNEYITPYQWPLTRSLDSGNYTGIVELLNPSRGDYNLCFFANDTQGFRSPVVKTQIGLNNDGTAPEDTVDPTIWIKTPYEGDLIAENITIIAEGADDDSGLDGIQLLLDGVLLDNVIMPDYLPYPEATWVLDPSQYRNGEHNLTAIATDNAGNSASFSVIVTIRNPTSWVTWTIVGGAATALVIVTLLINSARKKKRKK